MAHFSKKLTLLASLLATVALGTGCEVTITTDLDLDGVPDGSDLCPGTRAGDPVDFDGCSTVDDDGDGIGNDKDACVATAAGDPVDADGCSTLDDDGDGVSNDRDDCPGTGAGLDVDATGCAVVVNDEGTLDAIWNINGEGANDTNCAAAGIVDVRYVVVEGTPDGPEFRSWDIPCGDGGFDSRTDTSAPTVPFDMMFFSFFQAIGADDTVLAESDALELELTGATTHATLATSDFIVAVANVLTVDLLWETGLGSGEFTDCDTAGVGTMVGYELVDDVDAMFFGERPIPCVDSLVFDEAVNAEFGPGTYTLFVDALADDGTKWGNAATACVIAYEGGTATVDAPCEIPVIP